MQLRALNSNISCVKQTCLRLTVLQNADLKEDVRKVIYGTCTVLCHTTLLVGTNYNEAWMCTLVYLSSFLLEEGVVCTLMITLLSISSWDYLLTHRTAAVIRQLYLCSGSASMEIRGGI